MSISSSPTSANQKRISLSPIERLQRAARKGSTPPPRISIPEWADRYRRKAKEAGSTSGKWRTSDVEIARGPMLAVTEPGVHIISAMCATQLLKTSLLENVTGYHAHLDPCPILLLQPKDDAAEQFSKERVAPFIKATPVLRDLMGAGKTRSSDDTLLYKSFPGGFLAMAGAGSPDNVARRPVRLVLADEIDKYPPLKEGDTLVLADERQASFSENYLSLRVCSPTVDGESRIAKSYEEGDQRRASLCCPHCQHRQFLEFFAHVNWDKDDKGQHLTATARVYCEACGTVWSEGERRLALRTIRWHQTRPFDHCGNRHSPVEDYARLRQAGDVADAVGTVWDWWEGDRWAVYRAKCPDCGEWGVDNLHASFHASKMFSPWHKDRPAIQAKKWIDAQGDDDRLQAWWNTQAALPHRPNSGKQVAIEGLQRRGEVWPADVPDGVAVITVGIDTQDARLELEVVGWGRNEESWSLVYEVIEGDLEQPEAWDQLDAYLKQIWHRADGRGFEIAAVCIDSGGSHTQKVYEFAKARLGRKIWAIKGESARNGNRSPVWPVKKPNSRNKASFRPVIIGVNAAKDTVRARLHMDQPGAGYMHFPADRDLNYFAQLTSEQIVVKSVGGRRFRVWDLPRGKANEALDCRVYAYAALCGLLHMGFRLNRKADEVVPAPSAPSMTRVIRAAEIGAMPIDAAATAKVRNARAKSLAASLVRI